MDGVGDERRSASGSARRKGMTVERMRAFAAAARAFHDAAPWRFLSDEDLIHVEAPSVGAAFRVARGTRARRKAPQASPALIQLCPRPSRSRSRR